MMDETLTTKITKKGISFPRCNGRMRAGEGRLSRKGVPEPFGYTQDKLRSKGRKGRKEKTVSFGAFAVCCCVMLNEVKHLLCTFPNSFDQEKESQSRFFVATLLRMTHESKAGC
jgi:hypothetical protein